MMRMPSQKQYQVLESLAALQSSYGTVEPISFPTGVVIDTLRKRHHADASNVNVLNALRATCRHGWVKASTITVEPGDKTPGAKIAWAWTDMGRVALKMSDDAAAKALGAAPSGVLDQKESDVQTTQEPPVQQAPWGGNQPVETIGSGQAPNDDLKALDDDDENTQDGGPAEIEEPLPPKETHVVEGSNQLTMLVVPKGSRLKPKQFTLKIRGREQEFGTTREYLLGEIIEFHGRIKIDKVLTDASKKDGSVVKVSSAVIMECDLLDQSGE